MCIRKLRKMLSKITCPTYFVIPNHRITYLMRDPLRNLISRFVSLHEQDNWIRT